MKSGFGVMSKADFFRLFSELYADQSSLSTDLRKRLLLLYPKIRVKLILMEFLVNVIVF